MKNLSIRHGKSSGNKSVLLLTVLALGTGFSSLSAQTNAASDQITAQPAADRIVPFRLSEQGVVRPVEWGLDTAWEDEGNIRRGQGFRSQGFRSWKSHSHRKCHEGYHNCDIVKRRDQEILYNRGQGNKFRY